MTRFLPRFLSLALLGLSGCAGDKPEPADEASPSEPAPEAAEEMPNGLYAMSFGIAAVGGLAVPFQLDVQTTRQDDGSLSFARFDLRAVGPGDALSEVLASAAGTEVAEEGFRANLGEFVLPGAFSVTGSDVAISAVLRGQQASSEGVCGEIRGELVTFGIDLEGSTFGAAPWEARAEGVPTSCELEEIEEIPRITDCPALTAGLQTDFVSGGVPRTFEVVLPEGYDASRAWPLVFVYHGFGGDIASMLDWADLRPWADTFGEGLLPEPGAILVVPQGEDVGGTAGWDAFSDPRTNLDLVLFDDLLTCARASFSVDADRVHVTGMSNGGLFTGYLLAARSDVIASAAPMSGGMGIAPLQAQRRPAVLALWGGPSDQAFDQDFDRLTGAMIDGLLERGHFVVGCDHGLGHTLDPDFWPWTLQFLAEHPRGVAPEPYEGGLPPSFPAYCGIR